MENMLSVPSTSPVIPFQSGSPIMIVGPTNSGKIVWVNRLLSHDMFTEIPKSILHCYSVYQKFFEEMKTNPDIKVPIIFMEGLPTKDIMDNMNNGNFHIIILHNMMETIVKSLDMLQLFTKYCHHYNISAVFIMQNVYHQGPYGRSISLNNHMMILFENS